MSLSLLKVISGAVCVFQLLCAYAHVHTYARNYNPSKLLQITLSIKELLLHYINLKSYRNHKKIFPW